MEVALTFGAVGDFISTGLLIKDIVSALDELRGSAKSYRELIEGITLLGQVVEQAAQVYQDSQPSALDGLEDLVPIANATTVQICTSLQGFRDRISAKYSQSLVGGGSGNLLKDVSKKIQWRVEEKDVEKFRTEILGYTTSMKLLLEVTTV